MKRTILVLSFIGLYFSAMGCVSNNVGKFTPDLVQSQTAKEQLKRKIFIDEFTMKEEEDKNSIACRGVGNIYLPNKTTYSQYIQSSFSEVLVSADRYATSQSRRSRTLMVELEQVDFSSVSGTWVINGSVIIGQQPPVEVNSTTEFGTSWMAYSACENVAEGFQTAVQDFIAKALSDPAVLSYINK